MSRFSQIRVLEQLVPSVVESKRWYSPEESKKYRPLFEKAKWQAIGKLRQDASQNVAGGTASQEETAYVMTATKRKSQENDADKDPEKKKQRKNRNVSSADGKSKREAENKPTKKSSAPSDSNNLLAMIPRSSIKGVYFNGGAKEKNWTAEPRVYDHLFCLGCFNSREQAEVTVQMFRKIISKIPYEFYEHKDKLTGTGDHTRIAFQKAKLEAIEYGKAAMSGQLADLKTPPFPPTPHNYVHYQPIPPPPPVPQYYCVPLSYVPAPMVYYPQGLPYMYSVPPHTPRP